MKARITACVLFLSGVLFIQNIWAAQPVPASKTALEERFGNFSTAGTFVLIRIQNASTNENAVILCENLEWFDVFMKIPQYSGYTQNEYTDLMVKKYNQTFVLPADLYGKLAETHPRAFSKTCDQDKEKGMQFVADKYLEKRYWDRARNSYVYNIKQQEGINNRSIIRMFLEMGFVVRRDCESGEIYIGSDEVDARLK